MSRFLFIDKKEDSPNGLGNNHLLSINICSNCKIPAGYKFNFGYVYPGWVHGPEECFTCGKSFDGNTSAYNVIIDLDEEGK